MRLVSFSFVLGLCSFLFLGSAGFGTQDNQVKFTDSTSPDSVQISTLQNEANELFVEGPNQETNNLIQIVYEENVSGDRSRDVLTNEVIPDRYFEKRNDIKEITLKEGIAAIGKYAFLECENLTTIHIPSSVERIEEGSFVSCKKLEHVIFDNKGQSKLKKIAKGTFACCSALKQIDLPSSVVELEDQVFSESGLETFSNDSVTQIGSFAFTNCKFLKNITIPKVKILSKSVFEGCEQLETFDLIEMRPIENEVFVNYTELSKASLQGGDKGISEIGEGAFRGCLSLSRVKMPQRCSALGKEVFKGCVSLKEVEVPIIKGSAGNPAYDRRETLPDGFFEDCTNLTTVVVPQYITAIGKNTFANCSNLMKIEKESSTEMSPDHQFLRLPFSVQEVDDRAFCGCEKLSLSFLEEKNDLIKIGKSAFENCQGFSSVHINTSVKEIEERAFKGCQALNAVVFDWEKGDLLTGVGKEAFAFCCNLNALDLPDSIQYIGPGAFQHCAKLETLVVPEQVKRIEERTFLGCVSLASIQATGVESIGKEAFSGCLTLNTINFSGVCLFEIGEKAFFSCSNLENFVYLGLKKIGAYAFQRCEKLRSLSFITDWLDLGKGAFAQCFALEQFGRYKLGTGATDEIPLKHIAVHTFEDCINLKTVSLPKIRRIGVQAFKNCRKLQIKQLGKKLQTIGKEAFCGCSQTVQGQFSKFFKNSKSSDSDLKMQEVQEIPEPVNSEEMREQQSAAPIVNFNQGEQKIHIVYCEGGDPTKDQQLLNLTEIPEGCFKDRDDIKEIILSEGVTTIGREAFSECKELTKIHIPASVQCIKDDAFWKCGKLEKVIFHNKEQSQLKSILDRIFYSCSALKHIDLPASVTEIGKEAFSNSGLETFSSDSVQKIGMGSFIQCQRLKNVKMPKVKTISDGAFFGCKELETFDLKDVESIGNTAFGLCFELDHIVLWKGDGSRYVKIGVGAFARCSALKTLDLPQKCSSLGEGVFSECRSLKEVWVPEIVVQNGKWLRNDILPNQLFADCTNLSRVVLPGCITDIGDRAFDQCSNLIKIEQESSETDPSGRPRRKEFSVKKVGNYAFRGCKRLLLPFLEKENDLNEIGKGAFEGCSTLAVIHIDPSVTSIKDCAFKECMALKSVFFDEKKVWLSKKKPSLTAIGKEAFAFCLNLREIVLPSSVQSIDIGAFKNCRKLGESSNQWFVIPGQVKTIEDETFLNCSSLSWVQGKSVTTVGKEAFSGCLMLRSPDFSKGLNEIGEKSFWNCSSLDTFSYQKIQKIGAYAFQRCEKLQAVVLSQAQDLEIEEGAFAQCFALKQIGQNNKANILFVRKLEDHLFEDCKELQTMSLPLAEMIGSFAFKNCENLRQMEWGEGLQEIEEEAFHFCQNLMRIGLFLNVKKIGEYCFAGCLKIDSADLTMSEIPEGAFHSCDSLKTLRLQTTQEIGEKAFQGCVHLRECTFPDTLKKIKDRAFLGCQELQKINSEKDRKIVLKNMEYIGQKAFYCCFHVRDTELVLENITQIGQHAFDQSQEIKVSLRQIKEVPPACFFQGDRLEKVFIEVQKVEKDAFLECARIQNITLASKVESVGEKAFHATPSKAAPLEPIQFCRVENPNIQFESVVFSEHNRPEVLFLPQEWFTQSDQNQKYTLNLTSGRLDQLKGLNLELYATGEGQLDEESGLIKVELKKSVENAEQMQE